MRSPLLPIFLVVAVDILGLTLILPLLPFYAERLGASPVEVGLLVSVYAACQLVAGPLIGRISDIYGRRRLLLVSQAGTLIGFFILAYAGSLRVVFLSRVIDGLTAGNISLAQAYIADVTKPEERSRAFGIIGIAFGLGFLVGPGVSGFLSQFGYQYPIFAAAALSATSIAATWFLLPETTGRVDESSRKLTLLEWRAYAEYFRRPVLAPLLWQFFAFAFSFSVFMSGFPLFAERRFYWSGRPFGAREVGYVYAYVGLLGILVQGAMGRLVRRFGERSLIAYGSIGGALGYALLGFAWTVPALLAVAALTAVATALCRPPLTSLITQQAGPREQGLILGLTQSLMSVSQIVAPLIAGSMIQQGWLTGWALFGAAVCALGLAFHGAAARRRAPVETKT